MIIITHKTSFENLTNMCFDIFLLHFECKLLLKIDNLYLVQLIRTPNMNPEFLQRIVCLFTFCVLLQGKSFKLISQYTQKCQYNSALY